MCILKANIGMKGQISVRRLLAALLCAAPLVGAPAVYEVEQPLPEPVVAESAAAETVAPVEMVYLNSMGCCQADCTDPTHYHHCAADCTVAEHCHDCPVDCADPAHPHSAQCWDVPAGEAPTFCPSMGCALQGCTDPTHYHACPEGCAVAGHYHSCPAGCTDPTHSHSGYHHGGGWGHHGGRHH